MWMRSLQNFNKLFLSFCFLFSVSIVHSYAQSRLNLERKLQVTGNSVAQDNMQNLYILNDKSISKYSAEAKVIKTYSNQYLGNISFSDVSNSLRIFLYYNDFGKIAYLDNMLSLTGDVISLQSMGYDHVKLACPSQENGFWIYNTQEFKLLKFSPDLRLQNESGNLSPLFYGKSDPVQLVEQGNHVFLFFPGHEVFIFDRFGTFLKSIPIGECLFAKAAADQIVFIKANTLHTLDIKTLEEKMLPLPVDNILDFFYHPGLHKLSLLTSGGLFVYSTE
jgi:hypothetical protein